eukprot:9503830-Pyramimonas_sp.AAC.4
MAAQRRWNVVQIIQVGVDRMQAHPSCACRATVSWTLLDVDNLRCLPEFFNVACRPMMLKYAYMRGLSGSSAERLQSACQGAYSATRWRNIFSDQQS